MIQDYPITVPAAVSRLMPWSPALPGGHDPEIRVLRLDLLHPVVSGNKWFKLKYYLEEMKARQINRALSFGGAYSNHIVALAAACRLHGYSSTGIIRGGEPAKWSHTLKAARDYGMELKFVSRQAYAATPPEEWPALAGLSPAHTCLIPEGGYGPTGARGCALIPGLAAAYPFTHIVCAVGTGTMLAGIINALPASAKAIGISVLKNHKELEERVRYLLINKDSPVTILHNYHFGGYAKANRELFHFMNQLYRESGLPTDFVYSAKLCYAVKELAAANYFPPGSRILVVHSGGLQGNLSLAPQQLIF